MKNIFLEKITLTNFATFKHEDVHFTDGLNAIIGETGSGKSLILDALQFIMGQRADKKFIRIGSDFSVIEAVYKTQDTIIKDYCNKIDYPFNDDEIHIKRIIYHNGSSKCFLNFQQCNLQILQSFSKRFTDFVGQFENQKLLNSNYQLKLLDRFCVLDKKVDAYTTLYEKLKELEIKKESLNKNQEIRTQRIDFLNFQINEIEKINPSIEREESLVIEKNKLLNLKNAQDDFMKIKSLLSDGNTNSIDTLKTIINLSEGYQDLISSTYIEGLKEALSHMEDFSYEISRSETSEDKSEDLEEILTELDKYQKLKRKYGGDTGKIITSLKSFKDEVRELNNIDVDIDAVDKEISLYKTQCTKMANEIHNKRKKGSLELSKLLTQRIRKLNMKDAHLELEVEKLQTLNSTGLTQVNFMSQTNKGEGFYLIKDIASGGELSRILLALRQVLSSKDSISIFLFDEIDTGIGGETALLIGKALKEVTEFSQVIAITHLPQIANQADKLIVVDKKVSEDDSQVRTISFVKEIYGKGLSTYVKSMTPLN